MFDYEDDPVWLYAAWEFALEDDERDNQEYSDDAFKLLTDRFFGNPQEGWWDFASLNKLKNIIVHPRRHIAGLLPLN